MRERLHRSRYQNTEDVSLLYRLQCVRLYLTDVLPLVLDTNPTHGQIVPLQPQSGVLPDDHVPRTDQTVVLLPDDSPRVVPVANVSNLTVESDLGTQLDLIGSASGEKVWFMTPDSSS